MKLYQYKNVLETLHKINAIQELNYDKDNCRLIKTQNLIASVTCGMYKPPGFMEMIARSMTLYGFCNPFHSDSLCHCSVDVEWSDFLPFKPNPIPVRTEMLIHKILYA